MTTSTAWFDLQENNAGNWAPVSGLATGIISPLSYEFEVGETVNLQLEANGQPPPTWSISAGTLPPGLSFTTGGLLTGVPTTVGAELVTIVATGDSSDSAIFTFTIKGTNAGARPTILPTVNLVGLVNTTVSRQLRSTGNPVPTWNITSGSLPPGMTIGSLGLLSGIPTQVGDFPFSGQATNSAGSDIEPYIFSIHKVPVVTNQLSVGLVFGEAINLQLTSDAYPFPTWTLSSGSLPYGLELTSSGVLTGTPIQAGQAVAVLLVANEAGVTSAQFAFDVPVTGEGPGAGFGSSTANFFAFF